MLPHDDVLSEYQALTPTPLKVAEEIIVRSWWVILFLLLCYIAYEQGLKKYHVEYQKLEKRLHELQTAKVTALVMREDLLLQINSQSDQAWIELTLMKGLGLVAEDNVKIFFKE